MNQARGFCTSHERFGKFHLSALTNKRTCFARVQKRKVPQRCTRQLSAEEERPLRRAPFASCVSCSQPAADDSHLDGIIVYVSALTWTRRGQRCVIGRAHPTPAPPALGAASNWDDCSSDFHALVLPLHHTCMTGMGHLQFGNCIHGGFFHDSFCTCLTRAESASLRISRAECV